MAATLEDLRALVGEVTHGLADVTEKKAFGSFGYYVRSTIFALAYTKELRIGVKLPDEVSRATLMATPGASVWAPHKSPMSGWVLVPEAWHDDPRALAPWVRRAYEQVVHTLKAEQEESAIEILHRGSTTARTLEKHSKKTAAASSPRRKHSGASGAKKKTAARATGAEKTAKKKR